MASLVPSPTPPPPPPPIRRSLKGGQDEDEEGSSVERKRKRNGGDSAAPSLHPLSGVPQLGKEEGGGGVGDMPGGSQAKKVREGGSVFMFFFR